jgi:alpha-amylase
MSKRGVVLYLHAHQPWRVKDYSVFDTAVDHQYFNDATETDRNNEKILRKVADKSYRPMNALLKKLLDKYPDFKISLSITGTLLEQAEAWTPDVIEDFKALIATGRVEVVGETYYHSLAFFYSRDEFEHQVEAHRQKIKELFGVVPTAFRNTELAYNDELAKWTDDNGYRAVLAEGWDPVLTWRSPNFVYRPSGTENVKLLLKNYRLSDDLAFRFSDRAWEQYPLNADTYSTWIDSALGERGDVVNLFMDYETFGENVWEDTGIFGFFEHFVGEWLKNDNHTFYTVTEAADSFEVRDEVSMPNTVTWADTERDLSAWLGNNMQHESMHHLYAVENDILRSGDINLIADWRKLTTSDHSYYMCTKWSSDGDVHAYFSPYESPYDAFLYYMNTLRDVRYRLMEHHHHGGL